MTPIKFTILGQPYSKANSRQIVTIGGRPSSIKSKEARGYERDALRQIPPVARQRLQGPVRVTLRIDPDVVSVPRIATQSGQLGNFIYVVENGVARSRKVTVGRFQDGRDVILDGLKGGETIVSDGALLLIDGSRVEIRKESIEKKGAI